MKECIVAAVTFFLLVGCQNQEPSQRKADLYARYEQESELMIAQASFIEPENGKWVPKVFPQGVSFLGSGMLTRDLQNGTIRYDYEMKGNLPKTFSFSWPGDQGNPITLAESLAAVDSVRLLFEKGIYSVEMESAPLDAGEKLILLLIDAQGKNSTIEFQGPIDPAHLELPPSHTGQLTPGPASLSVVRSKMVNTELPGYQCRLVLEFYAQPRSVEL